MITEFRSTPVVQFNSENGSSQAFALASTRKRAVLCSPKCANPRCLAIFRHLYEGRLFMFEGKKECSEGSGYGPSAEVMGKVHDLYGLRYAWLSDRCAERLDVTFDGDGEFQRVAKAA
jgi:hypothetical protein